MRKYFYVIISALALTACTKFFEGDEGAVLAPKYIKNLELKEIEVPFSHQWEGESWHLVASAAIDVDRDGVFEVFVGGGLGQEDVLLAYENGKIVNKIAGTGLSSADASYGATAIDVNNNGLVDLIVMRKQAATIYYAKGGGKFRAVKLPLRLPEHSAALNATPIDIERDGDVDLYVSIFIDSEKFRSATYNDPTHLRYNILLRNDGVKNDVVKWKDITDKVTRGAQNSFTALAVDLNKDNLQDLVLAQNTGQVEILHNLGNQKFARVKLDTGYGFWMGMAAGDIDNDGDVDMLFSNSGSSIISEFLMGDLEEGMNFNSSWLMLRNDGNFKFKDISKKTQISQLGFGWGVVFEDMNYDGDIDMFASQNYINWPFHRLYKIDGKIMLNDPRHASKFYLPRGEIGKNPYFGHTPLLVDINGDGKKDLFWINSDGPVKAFLNKTSGNNYFAIAVPDNVQSLGGKVEISYNGKKRVAQITSSQGLTTDQPPVIVFGLGKSRKVDRLKVRWSNGKTTIRNNPPINKVISIKP